ncbi:MAG: response regulator [Myxococcales bacterium FL481]|nr:MAG: response regulator [Myxococcales bacterium FL481]
MADHAAKILVIDDSLAERECAQSALCGEGYAVLTADDGQSGLELALGEEPDLVLLDVVMPRLNGLEVCRILKAKAKSRGRYLPIIMLSTRNSANARVEGLRSGADDYLGKPYDAEELRVRVRGLLHHRVDQPTRAGSGLATSEATNLEARLAEEFDRAQRYEDPLACVCVGDPSSPDEVRVAMRHLLRQIDVVFPGRAAGEHVVLLPNTHFPGALAVAERIVTARDTGADAGASAGVAFYPHADVRRAQDLVDLASESLGHAQQQGRGYIGLVQHQGYVYSPQR